MDQIDGVPVRIPDGMSTSIWLEIRRKVMQYEWSLLSRSISFRVESGPFGSSLVIEMNSQDEFRSNWKERHTGGQLEDDKIQEDRTKPKGSGVRYLTRRKVI